MPNPSPRDDLPSEHINAVPNPRQARCEIIDVASKEVWQDCDPTPLAWYEGLDLQPPLAKAGYGAGNMDRMWFRRSPGATQDGPVRRREIEGRPFFLCAKPIESTPDAKPRRIIVDKHHTLVYERGRRVEVLRDPDGADFVRVVDGVPGAPAPALPEGWRLRVISLEADWVVELPNPTETYWFEGMVSFQGPIEPPG